MKIILDLYSGSGSWSKPYRDARDIEGNPIYEVRSYELKNGQDVRLITLPDGLIHGILAGPPCQHFASSGAWKWEEKGDTALIEALSCVDAVYRLVAITKPQWWVMENPVGRLKNYIGSPVMWFNPCDYGDPYKKKTGLWGNFNQPIKTPVEPTETNRILSMPDSKGRASARAITPPGFARAFFLSNP